MLEGQEEPTTMELLIAFLALVALGLLAARFGYDSRDGYRSHEHELASYGMTWDELAHQEQLAAEIETARRAVTVPTAPAVVGTRPHPAAA